MKKTSAMPGSRSCSFEAVSLILTCSDLLNSMNMKFLGTNVNLAFTFQWLVEEGPIIERMVLSCEDSGNFFLQLIDGVLLLQRVKCIVYELSVIISLWIIIVEWKVIIHNLNKMLTKKVSCYPFNLSNHTWIKKIFRPIVQHWKENFLILGNTCA